MATHGISKRYALVAQAFGTGRKRVELLFASGVLLAVLALLSPFRVVSLGLAAGALTVWVCGAWLWRRSRDTPVVQTQDVTTNIDTFIAKDATPGFIASADGAIMFANPAAAARFDLSQSETLTGVLKTTVADPRGLLFRLQTRAAAAGAAQEDVVVGTGHLRISVYGVAGAVFVWRVEQISVRGTARTSQEGFALPMIMLGRGGTILFMNDAARKLVGGRIKGLDRLFTELPFKPGQVCEISTADGPKQQLVAEVDAGAGRRALYLLPDESMPSKRQEWRAFHDLPVPLMKVNPEGEIVSFNKMASELIGVSLKERVQLSDIMEGLGRSITGWLDDTLAGRMVQKSEFLRLTRADKEVFVQVVLNPIAENGERALIAVMHDATELKSLEAKFVQSQKMQAIGELAGGVAHDFNNLLTAISGHCDLLLLRHDQGDGDYADLMQINQNANRAAALVGQLLAFSRKQTLRPEKLDMRDTLADLTHLLNRLVGAQITLTLSHDPVLQPIRADKRQLEQVLMNLVVNARDAMPAGGEIRIITECTALEAPLDRDRATVPPGEYVTVKVSDDGTGIPTDKVEKIFEPFFTTKRTGEGTGLGLSTAYGIIKQSGGFIFVDSVPGSGTTFTLYFPVSEAEKAVATVPVAAREQPLVTHEEGVILLVEDEAPVRAFASRALQLRGYTVLEAESAEAALKTLEDDSLNVDVFVTDVIMPGMDGPSWVREALKERPDVRVVFVSGYAEDSFGEQQTKIPNSVFLPKPFSLSELTETVHRQLH